MLLPYQTAEKKGGVGLWARLPASNSGAEPSQLLGERRERQR
jgi:hypothetical protein